MVINGTKLMALKGGGCPKESPQNTAVPFKIGNI